MKIDFLVFLISVSISLSKSTVFVVSFGNLTFNLFTCFAVFFSPLEISVVLSQFPLLLLHLNFSTSFLWRFFYDICLAGDDF